MDARRCSVSICRINKGVGAWLGQEAEGGGIRTKPTARERHLCLHLRSEASRWEGLHGPQPGHLEKMWGSALGPRTGLPSLRAPPAPRTMTQ